jgi:6-phosphogluconate dehydrogenase
MQLGMIGLGRMGANMVRRLLRAGHECVVFDAAPRAVEALTQEGAIGAGSLDELIRGQARWRAGASATWTSARAGACGASSAGIA